MRKNIFSWKSLAGLTLLIGLSTGLSSCEQVELPADPSNPEKPAEPGISKGTADLTLKLTKPADLDSLFQVWYKDEANQKVVKDAKEFTIDLETSDMKLGEKATVAQRTMTLNKALAGKTVNVNILNSFAEIKNPMILTLDDNIADKIITITLPDGNAAFQLNLSTTKAFVTLASAGESTLSRLELNNTGGANRPTTLEGVTVEAYKKIVGKLTVGDGASIVAFVATSNVASTAAANGVPAGIKDDDVNGGKYGVNSLVAEGDLTVSTVSGAVVNKITIAAEKTVTLSNASNGNKHPYVNEIVGLGDATKGKASKVIIADAAGLTNIATLNNVTISSSASTVNVYANNGFTKTTISGTIKPNNVTELSGVIVAANSNVTVDVPVAEYTFTFNGVSFDTTSEVKLGDTSFLYPVKDADGNPVILHHYYYINDIDADPDDDDNWIHTTDIEDIPENYFELDKNGETLWFEDTDAAEELYESKDGTAAKIVLAFDGGKYGTNDLTAKAVQTLAKPTANASGKPQPKIKVNGQLYKWYNTKGDNGSTPGWILVTTNE